MKVKINYTVDLKDVPNRADPLLEQAAKISATVVEEMSKLKDVRGTSIEKCLRAIEEIRASLADIDVALSDADAMLAGYLHLITSNEIQDDAGHQEND